MTVSYREALKLIAEQDRLKAQYARVDATYRSLIIDDMSHYGTHKETCIVYDIRHLKSTLKHLSKRITEIEEIINE